MAHLALYRRYRPKTFKEIVGQEAIVKTLINSLKTGRIAHAYLFCGQRGTGKTTIARLLAKALNCQKLNELNFQTNELEPCNQCENCQEINEGHFLDLIEIDAASNRGIDEIRNLKEGVRFSPIKAPYKVFIIDEAHMLTKEAFNALLKTLEEPPSHVIFILATTEPEKMPATIISRTQRFDFKKLTLKEIMERLKKITEAEGKEITEPALKEIALSAEGSLRDAESLLDQLISLGYQKIDTEILEEVLGRVNFQKIAQFLEILAKKEIKPALALINELYENGVDLGEFSRSILKNLRKILLLKSSAESEKFIKEELTEEEFSFLKKLAEKFSFKDLEKLIDQFLNVKNQIKYSPLPTLPLELIILENAENKVE